MKRIYGLLIILVFISACGKGKSNDKVTPEPPSDTTLPGSTVLKVMTYNIHRGNPPGQESNVIDLQATANVIKAQQPDLVSLNEVDKNTRRSGINVDEAKELGRLTGMYYFFAKAMDYDGGEYGDAVLSKYPIIESKRIPLPYAKAGSEPRDIAMITIEVDGKKILFASTHLDHLSTEENRLLQANKIVDDIIPNLSYPLIIGGDMNAFPDSKTIAILNKKLKMGCSGNNCPLTFPYDKPTRSIDYIMFTPASHFTFLSYKAIEGLIASDHLPLVAEIRIEK